MAALNEYYYWRSGTGHELNLSQRPYQVLSEDGFGGADIAIYEHVVPLQDGSLYGGNRVQARVISIGIELFADDRHGLRQARQLLLQHLNPKWGLGAFGQFYYGKRKELYCIPTKLPKFGSGPFDYDSLKDTIEFRALDPGFYDPTERKIEFLGDDIPYLVFPITFPIKLSTLLMYAFASTAYGDWPTYPIITINGPITDPVLENLTTGEKLDFTDSALSSTESIVIDCRPGIKTVGSNDDENWVPNLSTDSVLQTFHIAPPPPLGTAGDIPWQMGVSQETWAPDGVNEFFLSGSDTTSATAITIAWHDRYSGI